MAASEVFLSSQTESNKSQQKHNTLNPHTTPQTHPSTNPHNNDDTAAVHSLPQLFR